MYLGPEILPAGDVVLFQVNRLPGLGEVVAVPLSGGPPKRVLPNANWPRYVPTGHLLYGRSGRLMAAPFDPTRVAVTGPPVAMFDGLYGANFSFGASGTLVYSSGNPIGFRLVWVDQTGVARQIGPVKNYHHPALSPDGRRIAVTVENDIWVYDLERESLTQVTSSGGYWPIWTPDGKRLTYVASRNDALNVVWKSADGVRDEEQLATSPNDQSAASWSPDGQILAFQDFHTRMKSDIWLLDVRQGRKLRCFLCTDADEGSPVFSPDGQWLAYTSYASGPSEVYVRRVDGVGERHQISNGLAYQPLWSRDGKQIFYWKGRSASPIPMQMMAVDVTLGPAFRAGKPRLLFEGRYRWGGRANYDVTADGQQFLMLQPMQSTPITQLELVVNWFEELRARVRPSSR